MNASTLRSRLDLMVWTGISVSVIVLLERLRAPRIFFHDEWAFVLGRRGNGLETFLEPHNGHLSALPVLAYKLGFAVFGLDHYRPYRVGALLVHALVATLVFVYVRRRLGSVAGIAVGAVMLLLGAGWQNILWPFQVGFMGSVGAGIAAWLALDRGDRRGDICASVALGVAFACSGLGIPIFIGTAARLVGQRSWQRLPRVLAVPGALYAVWYLAYGQSQGTWENVELLPRFVVDAAASSVAALFGRDLLWGRLLLGVVVGFAMALLIHRRTLAMSVVAPAVCASSYWLLSGYSRAQFGEPGASRYVYVGAALLILVLADLLEPLRGRVLVWSAVLTGILGVWGNWWVLHAGAGGLRESTQVTRTELRAVEWTASSVDPAYRPDTSRMPDVVAGAYLTAIADLGSPAASDAEVAGADNVTKSEVDRVSMQALRVALVAAPPPLDDTVDGEVIGDHAIVSAEEGLCTRVNIVSVDGLVTELLPLVGRSVTVTSTDEAIEVRLRRYADTYPSQSFGTIGAGMSASISIPPDAAPVTQWRIELRSLSDVTVCGR